MILSTYSPSEIRERNARLVTLLNHLEHGQLSVDKLSIAAFIADTDCGTVGCLLGECPTVFPKDWTWTNENHPVPALSSQTEHSNCVSWHDPQEAACHYFGLSTKDVRRLFYAGSQRFDSSEYLNESTTPEELISNLRTFLVQNNILKKETE